MIPLSDDAPEAPPGEGTPAVRTDTVASDAGHAAPRHRAPSRRRPWLWGGAVALVLVLVLVLVLSRLLSGGSPPAPSSIQPVGGPGGVSWQLQMDEDFDGDTRSVLDSGRWHPGWFGNGTLTGPVNSDETALFSRDNFSVADGVARFEVTPNSDHRKLADGTTAPNLGAALNSDESQAERGFMMSYGYVEARMQLPAGTPTDAVWPGFWLNGHTWPDDMEIDIVEGNGTDQGCKFNIHYGHDNQDTNNLNDSERHRTVPGATTGMHTYAADVRPDGVTFYYDGVAVFTYHGAVPDAQRYVMVGVSTSGQVDSSHSLEVDYVRAWTRG
jgi:hypothetical protein